MWQNSQKMNWHLSQTGGRAWYHTNHAWQLDCVWVIALCFFSSKPSQRSQWKPQNLLIIWLTRMVLQSWLCYQSGYSSVGSASDCRNSLAVIRWSLVRCRVAGHCFSRWTVWLCWRYHLVIIAKPRRRPSPLDCAICCFDVCVLWKVLYVALVLFWACYLDMKVCFACVSRGVF